MKIGFTLVELLVAFSVFILLFLGGYTGYREFSRRRALENDFKALGTNLNFAHQLALSGERSVCQTTEVLSGYKVTFASNSYKFYAVCGTRDVDVGRSYDLSSGTTFSQKPTHILYKVLGQGIDMYGAAQIVLTSSGNTRTLAVPGATVK